MLFRTLIKKYFERRLNKKCTVLKQVFKITTHLTREEMCRLYLLAKDRKHVLEIGSYVGASACCFGAALNQSDCGGKVFCIDTWNNDSMSEGNRDTWQEFQDNTSSYIAYIVPIRGFSIDMVNEVAAHVKSLGLLFIDGDHSYEGVKSDWEAYKRFLHPGSIVVFHDSGWAEGVKRVIQEDAIQLVASYDSLPNMWWGVIK